MFGLPPPVSLYNQTSALLTAAGVGVLSLLLVNALVRNTTVLLPANVIFFTASLGFCWGITLLREVWFLWPRLYHTGKFLLPPLPWGAFPKFRRLSLYRTAIVAGVVGALVLAAPAAIALVWFPRSVEACLWFEALVVMPLLAWAIFMSSMYWYLPCYARGQSFVSSVASSEGLLASNFLVPDFLFSTAMTAVICAGVASKPAFDVNLVRSREDYVVAWIVLLAICMLFGHLGAYRNAKLALSGMLLSRHIVIRDGAAMAAAPDLPDGRRLGSRVAGYVLFLGAGAIALAVLNFMTPWSAFTPNFIVSMMFSSAYYGLFRWRTLRADFKTVCRFYRDAHDAFLPGQWTPGLSLATVLK
jgi:hypothetical protein